MKQKFIKNIVFILIIIVLYKGVIVSAGCKADKPVMPENGQISQDCVTDGQLTGWQEIEGKKCYFSIETGEMLTGWQEIEEKKYYFSIETGEMLTGWQEIEGKKYYFSIETGEMLTGWQEIEEKKYYFSIETGEVLTDWQEIEGKKYYFFIETGEVLTDWQEIEGKKYYFSIETGEILTGRQEIDDKVYYFKENGILQTSGWINTGNDTYYCKKNGILVSGWKKIEGSKYYFCTKNNKMVTGLNKINGNYYIFNNKGKLAQSNGISIVKVKGNMYCAAPDGKAATGWQIKKNKLYNATKKGVLRKNTIYQGIILTRTGEAKRDINSQLKIKLIMTLEKVINKKMSKSDSLYACWRYITGGRFHYASKYPDLNFSNWSKKTAYNMFSTYSGNCYSYACAFAALASELGYRPYIVCGRVHGSRDRAPDGYTRHAWVKINGLHYDPEAQYAGWLRGVYARSSYPAAHKIQKIVVYKK